MQPTPDYMDHSDSRRAPATGGAAGLPKALLDVLATWDADTFTPELESSPAPADHAPADPAPGHPASTEPVTPATAFTGSVATLEAEERPAGEQAPKGAVDLDRASMRGWAAARVVAWITAAPTDDELRLAKAKFTEEFNASGRMDLVLNEWTRTIDSELARRAAP
jgi:hypothetical protein